MRQTQAPASDPGFKLPGDSTPADARSKTDTSSDAATESPSSAASTGAQVEIAPVQGAPALDTSSRDLAIGAAVFLVLLIVYFFVRNAYVHHLVVKRVAPSSAGSAGWLLLVGLSFVSAAAVLAVINASQYLSWTITAPLVAVGLVALVAALFIGRR